MQGLHCSTKCTYKVAVIVQHHSNITIPTQVTANCNLLKSLLQLLLYRDGYVGRMLCYHHHLVCILCGPVQSLHLPDFNITCIIQVTLKSAAIILCSSISTRMMIVKWRISHTQQYCLLIFLIYCHQLLTFWFFHPPQPHSATVLAYQPIPVFDKWHTQFYVRYAQ